MAHEIKARKAQLESLLNRFGKISSESIITYGEEKLLGDYDLVYKKYVDDVIGPSPEESYPVITVGGALPSAPNAGDIHILDDLTVMQWDGDSWENKGTIPASNNAYIEDPSTPNTSALSYLNTNYPDAKPGDQVYKTAGGMRRTWTCYASGEWSRIDEIIET